MKSQWIRCFVGLCATGLASLAWGVSATVGNTAPGGRELAVEVDGEVVADRLAYLKFAVIEVAPGDRSVRLLDAVTREPMVLPVTWFVPDVDGAWLSLIGDGVSRPLAALQSSRLVFGQAGRAQLAVANAAVDFIEYSDRCTSAAGSGVGASQLSLRIAYGGISYTTTTTVNCRVESGRVVNGVRSGNPAFEVELALNASQYFVFVGNGSTTHPYQWMVVRDGQASQPNASTLPDILRQLKSKNYWFDTGRLSQGVVLHEVSRTTAVQGIWNTYSATGRPQWLYLDGGVVDASGRREILVYDYAIDAQGQRRGTPIARGILTYFDCNNAELQVRFADGSARAALFQRSIETTVCAATP